MIVPVILSGGSGTRLWPLSRKLHKNMWIQVNIFGTAVCLCLKHQCI